MGVTRNRVFWGALMLWLVFLVCAWSLVEYPWGFGLFVLGGCAHWAARRVQSQVN
jgi:hypothetical protein